MLGWQNLVTPQGFSGGAEPHPYNEPRKMRIIISDISLFHSRGRVCPARVCPAYKPKNLPPQLMQANKAFIFPQFAGSLWKSRRLLSLMKTFAGMGFVL